MTKQQIKEMLEKQLQLLSERSKTCELESDLCALTVQMIQVSYFLLLF